jgi:hypothetical protein
MINDKKIKHLLFMRNKENINEKKINNVINIYCGTYKIYKEWDMKKKFSDIIIYIK